MSRVEVKVPDIGDFSEVAVIEVLVKPGDTIKAEQSLVTVESDKASMEIPSSHAGVVQELKVKLGDKVAEGSVLLVLEAQGGAAAPAPAAAPAASAQAPLAATAPAQAPLAAPSVAAAPAASYGGGVDLTCDLLVLGARGTSFMRHLMLGSTAERLVRKSNRPLLVVRQPPHERYRRVIVALDFSPSSLAALELARAVAEQQ
jgi:pyruvate/2-oxoglutarate dehydrogenase complex dihydrolipoamide acyltransferase (E2) component